MLIDLPVPGIPPVWNEHGGVSAFSYDHWNGTLGTDHTHHKVKDHLERISEINRELLAARARQAAQAQTKGIANAPCGNGRSIRRFYLAFMRRQDRRIHELLSLSLATRSARPVWSKPR